MYCIGNFDPEYLSCGLAGNGYFDSWTLGSAELNSTRLQIIQSNRDSLLDPSCFPSGYKTYTFFYKPLVGFFNCIKPLATNHEVKITFERAPSDLALIATKIDAENPLQGKSIEINNAFCKSRYITSQYLRETIDEDNIQYNFDELSVFQKNLPTGEVSIRLDNIIGGQTPKYIFAGILPAEALNPDVTRSVTQFKQFGVKEFSFTKDGKPLHGFPLTAAHGSPIEVYEKFIETTNRKCNTGVSTLIAPFDFKNMHYIYAHKFEDTKESSWIGVSIKLTKAFNENYCLG